MAPDGVGYLIASGSSPVVIRLTADATGFGYSAQDIGNLQYDFAPTDPGSGDVAFDADGFTPRNPALNLPTPGKQRLVRALTDEEEGLLRDWIRYRRRHPSWTCC